MRAVPRGAPGSRCGRRWATTSRPTTTAVPTSRTHGTASVPAIAAAARATRIAADRPATSSSASERDRSGRPAELSVDRDTRGRERERAQSEERGNAVSIRSRWPTARSATETATRRAIATFAAPTVTSSSVVLRTRRPRPGAGTRARRGQPGRGRDAHGDLCASEGDTRVAGSGLGERDSLRAPAAARGAVGRADGRGQERRCQPAPPMLARALGTLSGRTAGPGRDSRWPSDIVLSPPRRAHAATCARPIALDSGRAPGDDRDPVVAVHDARSGLGRERSQVAAGSTTTTP